VFVGALAPTNTLFQRFFPAPSLGRGRGGVGKLNFKKALIQDKQDIEVIEDIEDNNKTRIYRFLIINFLSFSSCISC
jgi:hypothetical protein